MMQTIGDRNTSSVRATRAASSRANRFFFASSCTREQGQQATQGSTSDPRVRDSTKVEQASPQSLSRGIEGHHDQALRSRFAPGSGHHPRRTTLHPTRAAGLVTFRISAASISRCRSASSLRCLPTRGNNGNAMTRGLVSVPTAPCTKHHEQEGCSPESREERSRGAGILTNSGGRGSCLLSRAPLPPTVSPRDPSHRARDAESPIAGARTLCEKDSYTRLSLRADTVVHGSAYSNYIEEWI